MKIFQTMPAHAAKMMMTKVFLTTVVSAAILAAAMPSFGQEALFQKFQPKETSRVPEDIEWTITYSVRTRDTTLPRLLLIGDSIVHNYQGGVQGYLDGKMNVTFWSSSKCVTDPNYFRELDLILTPYHYDVISFNNGLHSFDSDKDEWKAAYRQAVKFIRAQCPDAQLLLSLATPVSEDWKTDQVREMNDFARQVAAEENLGVIDLFDPMMQVPVEKRWSDGVHFKDDAILIQADTVAKKVREAANIPE